MKKVMLAFVVVSFVFAFSCKKKKTEQPAPTTPLVFTSLTVNPSTVSPGENSTITATATGDHIIYKWATSHGDLLGSGSTVVFAAQPCCAGTNTITCTVSDGGSSIPKNVMLTVLPH